MQTIQAQVSARILQKADRLFTNRLSQIFVELLQNARRAGADLVSVTTAPGPADGTTLITFTDNGSGIDDFNKLLHLGESGWDEAVEVAEDPAGMGLFALLHSGVIVSSRGKTAVITTEAFLGKVPVVVHTQAIPALEAGTTLVFVREDAEKRIDDSLRSVVRYGSINVQLNGTMLDREDFLTGAKHIMEADGVRIGVFLGTPPPRDTVNFYGNTIRSSRLEETLSSIVLVGPQYFSDASGARWSMTARVDILSATSLHLKLPDRTDLVYDEGFYALKKQVRRALLEYLAKVEQHIAPFSVYKEAHELGIPLKEAAPYLEPFFVPARNDLGSKPFDGVKRDCRYKVFDAAECSLVLLEDDTAALAFDLANNEHSLPKGLVPVQPNRNFEGYTWYDSMSRCCNLNVTIDGNPAEDAVENATVTIVDSIQLSFDLERPGEATEPIVWDLSFAGWSGYDTDDAVLFITRASKWAQSGSPKEPFDLVDVAEHVAFNARDDAGDDSEETQRKEFRCYHEESVITVLGGFIAAARLALSRVLDWDLTTALNRANVAEVRLVRSADGHWTADIPVAA